MNLTLQGWSGVVRARICGRIASAKASRLSSVGASLKPVHSSHPANICVSHCRKSLTIPRDPTTSKLRVRTLLLSVMGNIATERTTPPLPPQCNSPAPFWPIFPIRLGICHFERIHNCNDSSLSLIVPTNCYANSAKKNDPQWNYLFNFGKRLCYASSHGWNVFKSLNYGHYGWKWKDR